MTDEELTRFMSSESGGKGLVWINIFKEIQDNNLGSSKKYKGQWRASDMTIYEGFGII